MQRPLQPGQLALANVLTREERAYMQEMASQHFQRILGVLRALPRPMLLVFRNINTVRSINAALGAPVDRYFLMAKRYRGWWDGFVGVFFWGGRPLPKTSCPHGCALSAHPPPPPQRRAELEPAERGEILRHPRQQLVLLVEGGLGEPEV